MSGRISDERLAELRGWESPGYSPVGKDLVNALTELEQSRALITQQDNWLDVLHEILKGIWDFSAEHSSLYGALADNDPERRISMALRDFSSTLGLDILTLIKNRNNPAIDKWKKWCVGPYKNRVHATPPGGFSLLTQHNELVAKLRELAERMRTVDQNDLCRGRIPAFKFGSDKATCHWLSELDSLISAHGSAQADAEGKSP